MSSGSGQGSRKCTGHCARNGCTRAERCREEKAERHECCGAANAIGCVQQQQGDDFRSVRNAGQLAGSVCGNHGSRWEESRQKKKEPCDQAAGDGVDRAARGDDELLVVRAGDDQEANCNGGNQQIRVWQAVCIPDKFRGGVEVQGYSSCLYNDVK